MKKKKLKNNSKTTEHKPIKPTRVEGVFFADYSEVQMKAEEIFKKLLNKTSKTKTTKPKNEN